MNALAYFVHSKISGDDGEAEKKLSSLEKLAWKDLQLLFDQSPQDVAETLKKYVSPAEWP